MTKRRTLSPAAVAAAQAGAARSRASSTTDDAEVAARATAKARRSPTVRRLLAGDVPDEGDPDPLELDDAEALEALEVASAAEADGDDPVAAILDAFPPPAN